MKKILLLLLIIFTTLSCSITRKVKIDFTYLDNPDHTARYYTAGREEQLLTLLNMGYFNDLGIELVVGTRTRVVDTALYDFRQYHPDSIVDVWYAEAEKYKRDGSVNLLIKHREPSFAGLGTEGVILIPEGNLLKGSTFLHEFGHAAGLEHYDDVCNVMYYTYSSEGVQEELTPFQKLVIKRYAKKL